MNPELNQPDGLHPNAKRRRRHCRPHRARCRQAGGRQVMSAGFAAAFAEGDAATLGARCLASARRHRRARRSASSMSASRPRAALPALVRELAAGTGIADWVGGVGLGICAAGARGLRPAGRVGADRRRAARTGSASSASTDDPAADLPREHARWIEAMQPTLALVHADPRCPDSAARGDRHRHRERRVSGRRAGVAPMRRAAGRRRAASAGGGDGLGAAAFPG